MQQLYSSLYNTVDAKTTATTTTAQCHATKAETGTASKAKAK
jgi:hypothetical protein